MIPQSLAYLISNRRLENERLGGGVLGVEGSADRWLNIKHTKDRGIISRIDIEFFEDQISVDQGQRVTRVADHLILGIKHASRKTDSKLLFDILSDRRKASKTGKHADQGDQGDR